MCKKLNRVLVLFVLLAIVLTAVVIVQLNNKKSYLQLTIQQAQQELMVKHEQRLEEQKKREQQAVEEQKKREQEQLEEQKRKEQAKPAPSVQPGQPKPEYVVPDVKLSTFEPRRVVALVFFGRKSVVSILLRYLQVNLKINGGVLDKVMFATRSAKKEDLDYLDSILSQNKSYYKRLNIPQGVGYTRYYELLHDDDLVFKIDDDVVFIQNGTFERMIKEYMSNNLLFLSANVVNHALLSFAHARIRAILPFIEKSPFKWELDRTKDLSNTVARGADYNGFSACWWNSGQCAAMAHESFLYHMENDNNELKAYDFKYWDFHSSGYIRWSINFFVGRGKYLNQMGDSEFDELMISKEIPERVGKHCYALGNSVVVHLHYTVQFEYINKTNLLDRFDKLSRKYLNIKE